MPKIVDHEQVRRDLLSQSFHHFASQGYRGVTMRNLAKELSISTGTLYHYFTNKSELFTQMLQSLAYDHVHEVAERLAPGADTAARLAVLLEYIAEKEDYFRKLIFIFCDLFRLESSADISESDPILSRLSTYFLKVTNIYAAEIDKHLCFSQKIGKMVVSFAIGQLLVKLIDPKQAGAKEFINWFTRLAEVDRKPVLQ